MQFDNLLVPQIWQQMIKVFAIAVTEVLIQISQVFFFFFEISRSRVNKVAS